MIAEHLKALELVEVGKLRGLMNGILNGEEWKESRVKLLHKGRLEMLVGYWKAFQWLPTGRVGIKLTILW